LHAIIYHLVIIEKKQADPESKDRVNFPQVAKEIPGTDS
jgi:hypothetical protein